MAFKNGVNYVTVRIMTLPTDQSQALDYQALAKQIKCWGEDLGFDKVGIADIDLTEHEQYLQVWLDKDMHGSMDYMHRHGTKRSRPSELVNGTTRVICARMDYAPDKIDNAEQMLNESDVGYISRYALGRDYHKVLRNRLQKLAQKISSAVGDYGYRVFTDSAPVLEKALAENAGLGWIGKHTNLIDQKTGSWFFLGEIYVDLPLPVDKQATHHCGTCQQCIDLCPTQAIVAPFQVDARLCISYLTIELKESIPEELRSKIGNRIYGCDDCQLVCPWNKFSQHSKEPDFSPRTVLTDQKLLTLADWNETEFLKNTEGSAIRRIGFERWLRNVVVAIGNMQVNPTTKQAALNKLNDLHGTTSAMVDEHIDWAIKQLEVVNNPQA